MNSEVEKLFAEAADLPISQRAQYLDQHSSSSEVRHEVEMLLSHDQESEKILAHAVSYAASSVLQGFALRAGHRIGAYRVLSVIGQGGMGTVYLGERADGHFEQKVAIKVVQAGQNLPALGERLQHEYRILAGLQHPNIATLLDAGVMHNGLPYFVMEYVAGQPIDRYCDEHKLPMRERLHLLLEVCDSVHYAHQKLVVHRDLKPDNILVTQEGIAKLLDFGVAKVLGAAPRMETRTHALTPEYASPEQIRGDSVTTATDVYSLGGVLYKLLTGLPPHQLEGKSPLEAMQKISEQEVCDPASICPELAGDVAHILQMALRREPSRRYRSVQQLADDLTRFSEHRPVLASPDTVWYRSRKFISRHAVGVGATAIVLIALITGVSAALWQAHRAERRFAQVRNLADVFLFDFEQRIRDVPGTLEARKMVASTAREYLASLSADARGDAGLTRELAESHYRLSAVEISTGENDAGLRDLKQAIELWRSVKDDCCGSPPQRRLYIRALADLATFYRRAGELEHGRHASDEAMRRARSWRTSAPNDSDAQRALLDALLADYIVSAGQGKPTANRDELLEYIGLNDKIAAQGPQDDSFYYNQARTENFLLAECLSTGDLVAARDAGFKAGGILDDLIKRNPDNLMYGELRVRVVGNIGQVLRTMEDTDPSLTGQVLEQARLAYELSGENARRDPQNKRTVDLEIVMMERYAEALDDIGRHNEALSLDHQLATKIDALLTQDPKSHRYQYMRLTLGPQEAATLMGLGRVQEAGAVLEKWHGILENLQRASADTDSALLDLEVTFFNIETRLSRQMGDLDKARERCRSGLERAASLIRKDALNEQELIDLPRLRKQAAELAIVDPSAPLSAHQ